MPRILQETNTQTGEAGAKAFEGAAYSLERYARIAGEEVGAGFGAAGRALTTQQEMAGQHESITKASDITDYLTAQTQKFDDLKAKADPNDPAWAHKFLQDYDDGFAKIGEDIQSPQARETFTRMRDTARREMYSTALHDQAAMSADAQQQAYTNTGNGLAVGAALHPETLRTKLQMAQDAGAGLRGEIRTKAIADVQTKIADGAGDGIVETLKRNSATADPKTLLSQVDFARSQISDDKGDLATHASEGKVRGWLGELDTLAKGVGSIQDGVLEVQRPRLEKIAAQGGQDGAQAMQALQYGAKNFVGSTPKETAEGRERFAESLSNAQGSLDAQRAVYNMSKPDMDKALSGLPAENTRLPAQQTFSEAAKQRDQEFKADPVQYVMTHNPIVSARYGPMFDAKGNFTATAEQFRQFADANVAEQRRLDPGQPPRVLPAAMEQYLAMQMSGVDKTPEGADRAAAALTNLQSLTGQYYNDAVHQLQAKKIVTGKQFAAAQIMGRPEGVALGREMLRAEATPEKDLVATSGVPHEAAVKLMAAALAPLTATFGDDANGHELMASYVEGGAAVLQARGKDAMQSGTATALANTMVMDRFNVRNNLRIPKAYDDHDVATGTDSVRAGLDKHDIQPPPSFSGFGEGLQRDAYIADVKDFGYWSTNQRGDGATLYYQGAPVVEKGAGGRIQTITIPFSQLQQIGRGNRSAYDVARRLFVAPGTLSE